MEPIKILTIDDDPSILDMYDQGLTAKGFEVKCAEGPKHALKVLDSFSPDIILTDIMMPGQDGISFMRDLKSHPKSSSAPILAVSALSDAATLNDALLFGAVDYLVKPFDIDTLVMRIKHALEMAQKRSSK